MEKDKGHGDVRGSPWVLAGRPARLQMPHTSAQWQLPSLCQGPRLSELTPVRNSPSADMAPWPARRLLTGSPTAPAPGPALSPHHVRTGTTDYYHWYLGLPAYLSPDWVMSRRQVSICTSRPRFMLHISMYSCRCRFMSFLAVASSSCQKGDGAEISPGHTALQRRGHDILSVTNYLL